MQGVRTTRGCIGCRRRKKGCDFQQPCGRCQRLKILCKYEARQYHFIESSNESYHVDCSIRLMSVPESVAQSSLLSTDLTLQIDAAFWALYAPQMDSSVSNSADGDQGAPWIGTVRTLATENNHLQTAVHALACAGLGWMHARKNLIHHGLRLYTRALREVNKTLQSPESTATRSDAVLASCRVLAMFEMYRRLSSSSSDRQQTMDWQSHIDGACKLFQVRGDEGQNSDHGRNLYSITRHTAVIFGIAQRRSNALTGLSDRFRPRGDQTLRDGLLDIMCAIPRLYQRFDEVGATTAPRSSLRQLGFRIESAIELLHQFVAVSHRLRAWEAQAIQLCRQKQARHDISNVHPTFEHQSIAAFCMLCGEAFFYDCANYWAACLKVFPPAKLLHRQLLAAPKDTSITIPTHLPAWMDPETPAGHLSDTTWYFFRPNTGLMAAQSAVFPVGAALFYYARTGRRESPIFTDMMETFASAQTGSIMLDFVRDIVDRA